MGPLLLRDRRSVGVVPLSDQPLQFALNSLGLALRLIPVGLRSLLEQLSKAVRHGRSAFQRCGASAFVGRAIRIATS
jgi:hypothetical protein